MDDQVPQNEVFRRLSDRRLSVWKAIWLKTNFDRRLNNKRAKWQRPICPGSCHACQKLPEGLYINKRIDLWIQNFQLFMWFPKNIKVHNIIFEKWSWNIIEILKENVDSGNQICPTNGPFKNFWCSKP